MHATYGWPEPHPLQLPICFQFIQLGARLKKAAEAEKEEKK
jgi:hypothetical protein